MQNAAVILAGGRGERFWPASRKNFPKQFLSLGGGQTLIQQTVARILPIVEAKNVFVVTNAAYKDLVFAQICQKFEIDEKNVIFEPVARNTAPAMALASAYVKRRLIDAAIAFLPSDHAIKNDEKYRKNFADALKIALQGENIATIGIAPSRAETGYGYIQAEKKGEISRVLRFKEKPDEKTAQEYLKSGEYFWNAGQFFAKASTILGETQKFSPKTFAAMQKICEKIGSAEEKSALEANFADCESLPFDIAIAEKSKSLFVVPAEFEWDDVGTWASVDKISRHDGDGNAFFGEVAAEDAKNCFVKADGLKAKKLVALVGVEDLAVIETDDALLVCKKSRCQDIKKIIETLKSEKKEIFL